MTALIAPFMEEMMERGFPKCYLETHVNMFSGQISLMKSNAACNHESTVRTYIRKCEIDDVATLNYQSVIELANCYVDECIIPEGFDEYDSYWYEDILEWWIDVFAYNIAELAMFHYFHTNKYLVDR